MRRFTTTGLIPLLLISAALFGLAQQRINAIVSPNGGHVALGLALRKLPVAGTFMQAPAHPDDETNALLAWTGLGMGLRTIDLQNNRGDGGQNEIGPELFRDMAVLRTSELLAAHRVDGAEQYFTRAIDYGYSFDPEEVIGKWGRTEIVGDYVRLIRTLRPDVIVTMNIQGRGGDRAHEATTVLVREAYEAAGDAAKYPEQISSGLHAWKPKKLYFSGGGSAKAARTNTGVYDSLLGRTYAEIGADARSAHKCQGMGGMAPLPGAGGGRGGVGVYQLMGTTLEGQKDKDEASIFDGIDMTVEGLVQYAQPNPPEYLTLGLAAIADAARRAQKAFDSGSDDATAAPVEEGLAAVRSLLARLDPRNPSQYEIAFRLQNKERDFEDAVLAAHGMTFEALADDGLVVGGQNVRLNLIASNRGGSDVAVSGVEIRGFEKSGACTPAPIQKGAAFTCSSEATLRKEEPVTRPYFTDNYWKNPAAHAIQIFDPAVPFGVPFAPSPFRVAFKIKAGVVEVTKELPVQYRYVKDTFAGEKRMELNVAPEFSVRVTPPLAVIPAAKPEPRDIFVAVTNGAKGKAEASVALDLPAGWSATPTSAPLAFAFEDESLSVRFRVTPPARSAIGEYTLRAVVTSPAFPGQKFTTGYQEIEYPHVERRQVIKPADTALKVVDVKVAPNVSVGYIVGVGDQVPPAIEQLGAKLSFIEPNELAWGDLAKYDVIMTGVRAYERRTDLRAYNRRLIDYANQGGAVIVQYNKMEFNQREYAPFPAKVSSSRISDELAPVKVLVPEHPVFNVPNKIGPLSWAGWVQERGLYFLGEKDKQYTDLIAMTDSFKDNPGEKLGSFVEGKVGKGRWMYLGLGLWRQLPAGTDGAYQLLANLLALGAK